MTVKKIKIALHQDEIDIISHCGTCIIDMINYIFLNDTRKDKQLTEDEAIRFRFHIDQCKVIADRLKRELGKEGNNGTNN